MCLILYTQRGWTGLDSIDRAFLPGEFIWEPSCWWGGFPACWKKLRKTIRVSPEIGQNAAITAGGFARDILKHGGKHLTAVSLVDANILLHKKEGLELLQLETAHTHGKRLLASFPIPSLNFYQPRGKQKAINTVCNIIWALSFGSIPGLFAEVQKYQGRGYRSLFLLLDECFQICL